MIDTDARVRAGERSIRQIEALLSRAQKLGDIIAIENDLARRQADLDSLKQQQAWLDDQTSLSTINVYLSAPMVHPASHESKGFLAGLSNGWQALGSTTVAVLTAVGAVLPFAVLIAVLGVPVWWVVRRRRVDAVTCRRSLSAQRAECSWTNAVSRASWSGFGRGDHAVAEVEDVARGGGAGVEHLAGAVEHHLGRGEDQRRVEVALHRAAADALDPGRERHPPVDAHDVGAGLAHQVEDLAGARRRSGSAARRSRRSARAPAPTTAARSVR